MQLSIVANNRISRLTRRRSFCANDGEMFDAAVGDGIMHQRASRVGRTTTGRGCHTGRPIGPRIALILVLPVILVGAAARGDDRKANPDAVDFFESKVRPVLVEHCYKCHSAQAKSPKGGLRLDSVDAMKKGGDNGPAVVPGDADASLLVQAVRYTDEETRMPPKGKLADATIATLEQWVRGGAVMPHGPEPAAAHAPAKKSPGIDFEAAASHWSYQAIRQPAIPPLKEASWPTTPVDAFVLAKLEAAGLTPAPPADRRTLLRRVTFDLIGLPPTAAEIAAFESDHTPDAYARVVDRLLSSPHYGERWGRHWLDVARYANTKDGVLMYGDDRVRPYAYTYRDYVIRAFNEDLGFDRMVQDQLAADVAAPRDQPWRFAAMGFLTLGKGFDNNIHDQIDDRIDVVSRGFLALTVSCARCHDHKYDAIPTADYYSFYGIFASCEAPLELPLTERPDPRRKPSDFEAKAEAKRRDVRQFLEGQYKVLSDAARQRTPDYLVRAATTSPDPLETAIFFLSLAPEDLRPQIVALAPVAPRSFTAGRSRVRTVARPHGPGRCQIRRPISNGHRPLEGPPIGHRAGPTQPDGRRHPGEGRPQVSRGRRPGLRRADPARRRGSAQGRADDLGGTGGPGAAPDPDDPRRSREPRLFPRESDVLLYVSR